MKENYSFNVYEKILPENREKWMLLVERMVILNQQSKQKENSLNYAKRMESRLSSYGFCYI